MNIIDWIWTSIESLLWTNDIDVFSIVYCFTNERNILKTENCQILFFNLITKNMHALEIKSTLAKNSSNKCTIFNIWCNFLQNVNLCMPRWADKNNICSGDNFLGTIGAFIDSTSEIAFWLPSWSLGVSNNLVCPNLWSSTKKINFVIWVKVTDRCDTSMSKISTSTNGYSELWFHT